VSGILYLSTLSNHYKFDSYNIGIYGHVNEHFSSANSMGHTLLRISIFDELVIRVLTHYLNIQLFFSYEFVTFIYLF